MWNANERVLARPSAESSWYPGTIRHVETDRCYVILDNRDDGWFGLGQLRALEIEAGSPVILLPTSGLETRSATVEKCDASGPMVRTSDGDSFVAEWSSVQVPASSFATNSGPQKSWNFGDRIFARWGGDLFWYPGTIFAEESAGYLIVFDDQDKAVVPSEDIIPLVVEVEDRVFCRPKFEPQLRYFPAEITRVDGEIIDVLYEDPDAQERCTNVGRIRIRRESGSLLFWEEGDRVIASGRDDYWFPAIVLSLDGDRTFVSFLDGRHGWLKPDEIRPLRITAGMSVQCRKSAAADYLPAIVEEIHGNIVHVKYEDESREHSLLGLLRIPAQAS